MGSPASPIVANLYMEYLEQKALSTAPNPPKFWHRYVDDTFVIHKEANKQGFLQHINSVDPAIRFTVEDNKEDGLASLWMAKVSSTYLCQNLGLCGAVLRAFCSKYSMQRLATMALTMEPMAAPSTCLQNWSWKEKQVLLRQNSNRRIMSLTASTVLSLRVWSYSSRSLMMLRAGSTGTEMNMADTSLQLRHSPGAKVMCLTCSTKSIDMVWGLANQWFQDFGKFLSLTIGDRSTTIGLRGVSGLWILGRPQKYCYLIQFDF